jgi:hypothetical protein
MNPGVSWWGIPQREDYTKTLQDEKALDTPLKGPIALNLSGILAQKQLLYGPT